MYAKRIIAFFLFLIIAVGLLPTTPLEANAASEDPYATVEQQVRDYCKSLNQADAATTAATAMLTNAAFLGKDLTFDKSSAMTAMLLNSYVLQDGLARSCSAMVATMQQLSKQTLYCGGSLSFRVESTGYYFTVYEMQGKQLQNKIGPATTSAVVYGNSIEMLPKYNANDKMLVSLGGDIEMEYRISVVEVRENSVRYQIDCSIFDIFDYDSEYSSSKGYNRDYEKLITAFGSIAFKGFSWKSNFSFQVDVPHACNHTTGAYHWEQDMNTHEMASTVAEGFIANPARKSTSTSTNDAGVTTEKYSYELQDPVILKHDVPWVVTYEMTGRIDFTMSALYHNLTAYPCIWQYNTYYAWIGHETWRKLTPAEMDQLGATTSQYTEEHYYGFKISEIYKHNTAHTYVYTLENKVADDGSNMVYMTVYNATLGQVVFGPEPMDEYRRSDNLGALRELISREDDGLNGQDIIINYIGNRTRKVNAHLKSVTIYENGMDAPSGSTLTETVVAPTCTAEGYTLHTCSKCNYSYKTDYTGKLEHAYVEKIVVPTCTAEGYTSYACRDCGYMYQTNVVEKLPHDVAEYTSNKDATCAHDGTKTGKCTVCGEKVTVADEGTALPHTWVDATCEKAKICKFCGATEGDALGHDLKHYNAKAPTCENVGWDAYEKCLRCSYSTFARLPALGHEHVNGVCTRCGDRDGSIVPGEVSGDGKIDMLDAYQIILHLGGKLALDEVQLAAADVNGDGTVNLLDIYQIMLLYREEST